MIRAVALIVVLLAAGAAAPAQEKTDARLPRFADYPASELSNARVKRPLIPKSWPEDPRLRFQDSVPRDARPNFAGHYYFAVWGCGTACVIGGIVETRTGRIIEIPFTVSGWREVHDDFQGIAFRKDSRLIVFSGEHNEMGDMGQHFYVLERGRLKWLRSIKVEDGNFLKKVE